jgi:hypothetical protein
MMPRHAGSFLDSLYARLLAGAVLALVVAALLTFHWEDIVSSDEAAVAGDDPVTACIAQRSHEIDEMIRENPQMSSRRDTMIARVAPMCEDLLGEGASPPPALPSP